MSTMNPSNMNTNPNNLSLHPTTSIRPPLMETSGNVPSPVSKKLRMAKNVAVYSNNQGSRHNNIKEKEKEKDNGMKSAKLDGEELRLWQSSWRKIMRDSVVYFDPNGQDDNNYHHRKEKQKAIVALESLGCLIKKFWDCDVTIIVSRRSFAVNETYNPPDIFSQATKNKLKVWSYEKVFRFMKHLGEPTSSHQLGVKNLSNLLKEEKFLGPSDRDPLAKRDDFHFLRNNTCYFFVYDLTQRTRPVAVREWPTKDYPIFQCSSDGRCPFTPDPPCDIEKRKIRRQFKFEHSKKSRMKLIEISSLHPSKAIPKKRGAAESNLETVDDLDEDKELKKSNKSHTLTRNSSSTIPLSTFNSNSKVCEVQASGFNASNAASYSTDSSNVNANALGNGLAPTISQVPSKQVTSLKKKIFIKKQRQQELSKLEKINENVTEGKDERLDKPGYCENCRNKYDHFDDHINSNRHRNFATNDLNFQDIDSLIAKLNHDKTMGYVSSS